MWSILICIGIALLLYAWIPARLIVSHPFATVTHLFKDIYMYFRHKDYNRYDGGQLNAYFAHFGGGKTLSVSHYVTALYRRYNNKPVWDKAKGRFVLQKVHVLSNVHLNSIPYEDLKNLSQIVDCAYKNKSIDEKSDTRTCIIVLLDEASVQLNSREFKTNINAEFLNALLTSRHFHMSIYYTTQKFKLVDALLRNVTQKAIWCHKVWRFMVVYYYDADEMEYATNPTLVQPYMRKGFFIFDKDYNNYDTLATVDKLKKSFDENDFMSEEEILALRGQLNPDNDAVLKPSLRLKRMRKK